MSASTSRVLWRGSGYKWEPFTSFGCGRIGITRRLLTHHELTCAALLTPIRPQPKLVNGSHLYPLPRHKTRDVEADISKTIKPKPRVQKQDGRHLIDLADSNSRQQQILLNHLWFSVCSEQQTAPSRHVLFLHKS
jgi:hypothetical protein